MGRRIGWTDWTVAAAGWVGLFVLFALHEYVSDRADAHPVSMAVALYWSAVEWLTWLPLTGPIWRLGRRYTFGEARLARAAGVLLVAGAGFAVAQVLLQYGVDATVVRLTGDSGVSLRTWLSKNGGGIAAAAPPAADLGYFLARKFFFSYFVFGVTLLAGQVLDAVRRDRARQLRAASLETQLARARLDALRAQLDPHFLFNTLNTIAELVHHDPARADRMITDLGDLLRHTLAGRSAALIPLQEELDLVEAYVGIERVRHPGISFGTELSADSGAGAVPPLLLQTLVENAIRHGVGRHPGGGRVVVRARRAGATLVLEVDDSGSGTPPALPLSPGLGLRNTMERLATLFPDRASVRWSPSDLGGLLVRVVLPAEGAAG